MKYTLETISPVHIGTGDIISPIEYVIDDKFYRVDMDELFKDKVFDNDKFIESAKGGQLYLGDFAPDLGKKHVRYLVDIFPSTKNSLQKSIGGRSSEVREFIKTGDALYIPGSSIKGAIRTAILWWVLKNDPSKFEKAESCLEDLISSPRRVDKKYADEEIEKLVFGSDPTHDLLKVLQVSDTNPISIKSLKIEEVQTLTTRPRGHGWKGFTTFIESLKPRTSLEFNMCLDKFLLKNEISREIHFDDKRELLQQVPKICNDFAKNFIEDEIAFFNEYDGELRDISAFYSDLKRVVEGLDNSFLLHLSWGSGWQGMTIGKNLSSEILDKIRRKFDLGKRVHTLCGERVKPDRRNRGYWFCQRCRRGRLSEEDTEMVEPFPKTRKIVFEDGKPKYPLGWVKIKVGD
jgi:CRISPR-associated protein Csm5